MANLQNAFFAYIIVSTAVICWLYFRNPYNTTGNLVVHRSQNAENCKTLLADDITNSGYNYRQPVIYAITPTYTRAVQKAELTRISQTFLHVPNFHWIVVEDSDNKTQLVVNFLRGTGLRYTHLNIRATDESRQIGKGLRQRNLALDWVEDNTRDSDEGVIFFADDDNTYDIQLFNEMRNTRVVSVWPVAFAGGARVERPIVSKDRSHVVGWDSVCVPGRAFAIDMAGFAVSLRRIHEKAHARFGINEYAYKWMMESEYLEKIATMDELEPKADACTKVYVWHTQTLQPELQNTSLSDLSIEV